MSKINVSKINVSKINVSKINVSKINVSKIIKFFLVLIIIHFFLHTFITFKLGIDVKSIWLWKEILLIIFTIVVIPKLIKNKKAITNNKFILFLLISFVLLVFFSFTSSVIINHLSLKTYILAFKYDFLGFFIFFVFYFIAYYYLDQQKIKDIFKFFIKIFKYILIWWIIWYSIISVVPGTLNFFWYTKSSYSGILNEKPPAVYFTQETHWIARNQFLFERPITYWFFLVMFWPLFYFFYIKNLKTYNKIIWWLIYMFNVISTFSRAAIWAWIFEILLIGIIQLKKDFKKLFIYVILPIIILWTTSLIFYKNLFKRKFSDTWHIVLVEESIKLFKEKPLFGFGAASAWPSSHWYCSTNPNTDICKKIKEINIKTENTKLHWFNNENQYLQILVEYGIIWLFLWLIIYFSLAIWWLYTFIKNKKITYVTALSIWLIWLFIEWMVLHSFVDRMIIYPAMILYWLALAMYFQEKKLYFKWSKKWIKKS